MGSSTEGEAEERHHRQGDGVPLGDGKHGGPGMHGSLGVDEPPHRDEMRELEPVALEERLRVRAELVGQRFQPGVHLDTTSPLLQR